MYNRSPYNRTPYNSQQPPGAVLGIESVIVGTSSMSDALTDTELFGAAMTGSSSMGAVLLRTQFIGAAVVGGSSMSTRLYRPPAQEIGHQPWVDNDRSEKPAWVPVGAGAGSWPT